MTEPENVDADRLEARVRADLPPASTWTMPPRGYRQALALCLVDGVSRQIVDTHADALVAGVRTQWGEGADTAAVDDLVGLLRSEAVGAPIFDEGVGDQTRATHVRDALAAACNVLIDAGAHQTTDLVEALKQQGLNGPIGQAWVAQNPLTRRMWTDTAMLAGYLDPDVDRMIAAYTSRAMGTDPETTAPARVIAALTEVASRFDVHILPLEFAILEHERRD